jgi:hypothetical protein
MYNYFMICIISTTEWIIQNSIIHAIPNIEGKLYIYIHICRAYFLFHVIYSRILIGNQMRKTNHYSFQRSLKAMKAPFCSCEGEWAGVYAMPFWIMPYAFTYSELYVQGLWCIIICRTLQLTAICIGHMSRELHWTYINMGVYVYMCVYTHTHIYIYIYIYIYSR